jgi:hypothetical protein
MAMRSCRLGQSSLIQLSKNRPNRTGSTRLTKLKPAHAGDAEMKLREPSQKIEMLLAPCHDVLARGDGGASQKQEDLGQGGYTTRQGSRSSAICEKCSRRTAKRARGTSSLKIASMVVPPESRPQGITIGASRQNHPILG